MVMLHVCSACQNGNHKDCAGSVGEPGHYGGSMCTCKCKGDPDYRHPFAFECKHCNHVDNYCTQCHAELEVKARKNRG